MTQLNQMSDALEMNRLDWLSHITSFLITAISITLITLLWRNLGALPTPEVLLLLTVAVSTYVAGGMAGMLSAGIVLFSSFFLFSIPGYSFQYTDMDWRQAMLIVVASPLIALMVGSLRDQVDQLRVVSKENDHLKREIERFQSTGTLLHLCEERFRLAADSIQGHAIVALDINGAVKMWSSGAEEIIGYKAQEIVGQSYSRFFIRDDILGGQPGRLLEIAEFSGRTEEKGWRLAKNGRRFRALTVISAVKSTAGPVAGYLMVTSDLTERANLEEALAKARAELEVLSQGRS
ncbi:MAG: PAS domain S-box protein [Betaproteobacteria bacterium]|nr:PAS domain S-box protein [Betaproteobacteria bacterium]